MSEARRKRKTLVGIVRSDKMEKTVVVQVEALRRHPLYEKTVRHTRTFKAHDEQNASRAGDRVLIMETRPLSKDKRWRVVQVLGHEDRADVLGVEPEAMGQLPRPRKAAEAPEGAEEAGAP
ncbi:MAG: 30S ribosomal protein S17 [Armatimonadetes bacterium]|nr:30S ribosomal protein S17 [Armatimonadota bacterium]